MGKGLLPRVYPVYFATCVGEHGEEGEEQYGRPQQPATLASQPPQGH